MEQPIKEAQINSINWSCKDRRERLHPEIEWDMSNSFIHSVTKIENPFLQRLINMNAVLTKMEGEWTLLADKSFVMFHIYEGFINLECISTPVEERGKGSATLAMKAIVTAAKETNTEIRLRACNVTGHGWKGMHNHIVVALGMVKKGKIPVAKLQKWYEKFGFVKVADVIHKDKKAGVNMIYKPQ